jgi:hypothetical protein
LRKVFDRDSLGLDFDTGGVKHGNPALAGLLSFAPDLRLAGSVKGLGVEMWLMSWIGAATDDPSVG